MKRLKNKILIIEDDFCKFISTKHLLEAGLAMKIRIVGTEDSEDLIRKAVHYHPNTLLFQPIGGVELLLNCLKKKKINGLNAEITLMVSGALSDDMYRRLDSYHEEIHGKPFHGLSLKAA